LVVYSLLGRTRGSSAVEFVGTLCLVFGCDQAGYTCDGFRDPGETLNPIAPEPLLQSFPGGLYWTLTYDRSVRLRVMPIDGDSGFSAVFFDEV
jgi:hypothetical protein